MYYFPVIKKNFTTWGLKSNITFWPSNNEKFHCCLVIISSLEVLCTKRKQYAAKAGCTRNFIR